ncbi:tetratricopeptide repeat protein [Streptomyces sp. NPDC001536]|uniref:tetratricopeptide repeat protein n=1 Tax=Streptomyces sp. NPDC001536 TaxID=3364583 RepID=UPI0036B96F8B
MQELIRQRRRAGFVGRNDERAAFRANLEIPPEDERHRFLFHVHGNAGVGKTFLVRELEQLAREKGTLTAYVDESAGSVPEALAAICQQLAAQGARLRKLEDALTAHRERRHEAEAEVAALEPTPEGPSPLTTTAVRLGVAGLGLIPGAGPFVGAVDSAQLAEGAARIKTRLSARFRNQEDVQLVLAPERVLTPKFLDELADVASTAPWLVLFFDTYESTGTFLDSWLHQLMTTDRYGELPANVIVVTAGQYPFDTARWGAFADFMTDVSLSPFTEAEARGLLAERGVVAEPVVAEVLRLTGGLPVLVSTLAESRPDDPDDVGDPGATAVERFLKWEQDPVRRRVALECALPRFLDADVFRAVVQDCAEDEARALYDWLRAMPFVSERGERAQYHDVVRAPMLRLERRRSPRGWAERHGRLADAFAGWREERRADSGDDPWTDKRWRELRLAEAYHRLCARESAALPEVLGDVVQACVQGLEEARRWARVLTEAGEDTQAAVLGRWGRDLLDALEEPNTAGALGLLLDRAEFDDTGHRAFVHAIRGAVLRSSGELRGALLEFDRAIALDGDLAHAYHGRGIARSQSGEYAAGMADLDRAHALEPHNARILATRADCHRLVGHYDAAQCDADRAIELDRTQYNAWATRGAIRDVFKQYDLALADLDQALALKPGYVWALVHRARVRRSRGEHELQLADLDRAVELSPDIAWVLCERGDALGAAGREVDALADYQRAIDLDDTYASVYASRGALHAQHGRYEPAMADLDKALRLRPEYQWALLHRCRAHLRQGRYDDALVDANRAVELGTGYPGVLLNRAYTNMAVGRLEQAQQDLESCLTSGDEHRRLAQVHLWSGRFEEALTELDAAAALGGDTAKEADVRCSVYLYMRDWPNARQVAERHLALDEATGLLNLALAVSGGEGLAAARPLWERLALLDRPEDGVLLAVALRATSSSWPELDDHLHRALVAPHGWPYLAAVSGCLDILLHSDGTDRARLEPRLERVVAARDAMRARYAE